MADDTEAVQKAVSLFQISNQFNVASENIPLAHYSSGFVTSKKYGKFQWHIN